MNKVSMLSVIIPVCSLVMLASFAGCPPTASTQQVQAIRTENDMLKEEMREAMTIIASEQRELDELREMVASLENDSATAIETLAGDGEGPPKMLQRNAKGHVIAVDLTTIGKREDVAKLSGLLFLEELHLPLPDVDDESLKSILPLKRLRIIDLSESAVSDEGIGMLKQLPAVEDMNLQRTSITDEAYAHLSEYPKLKRIRAARTFTMDSGLAHLKDKQSLELLDFRDCNLLTDAGLAHLKELRNLKDLKVWGSQITDAGLDHLQGMEKLKVLSLQDTGVTDAGMSKIANLTNLETLVLMRCFVTSAGTPEIAKLKKMRRLDLRGTLVNEDGMKDLAKLSELRVLDLSESIVANSGLEALTKLTKLEQLNLWGTRVGDAGMPFVASMTTLKALNLDSVGFPSENIVLTDDGIKQLISLENLESLHLGNSQVGPAGMEALAGLKKLKQLNIPFCSNVSDDDVKKLVAALPELKVVR